MSFNWPTLSFFILIASLTAVAYILWQRYQSRRRLMQRVAELEALSTAGRAMVAAEMDITALCQLIADEVGRIIDAQTFQIGLFNGRSYEILFWCLNGRRQPTPQTFDLSDSEGLVGWVQRTGQPLMIRDFQREIAQLPTRPRYISSDPPRSAIFIPLISGDTVIGTVAAQSHAPNRYSDEDQRRLTILANQAAAAIANARLFAQARMRAAHLELVSQIARQVNMVQELDELFEQVVTLTAATFGLHPVNIFTYEPEANQAVIMASSQPELCATGLRLAAGEGLVGTAVSTSHTIVSNDTTQDGRFLHHPAALTTPFDTHAEACFPLIANNRLLGVLDVQSQNRNAFTDTTTPVLEALAEEVASAIYKAEQLTRQREQAWVSTAQLQVAETLSHSRDLEEITTAVSRLTPMLIGSPTCTILLRDPETDRYTVSAHYEANSHHPAPTQPLAIGDWPPLDAVHVGQEAMTTHNIPAWLQPAIQPAAPLLLLPLLAPNQMDLLGVLLVTSPASDDKQREQSQARQQELLENIAQQTAQAIENARLRLAQQEEAWVNTALLQVAEAVNSLIDLNEILDTIVRLIPLLVGVESLLMLIWDEERELFTPGPSHGIDPMSLGLLETLEISHGEWQQLRRQPVDQSADWSANTPAPFSLIHPPHWLQTALATPHAFALPLHAQGRLVGVMVAGLGENGRFFSPRRLNILNGIAQQAATAVVNNQLYKESAERTRLEQELTVAQEIQTSFLPKTNPAIPGCTIASHWQAARQVSGDFYDFLPLSNGKWGLVIADVADKGVPAALFMALSRTVLRTVALNRESPAEVLMRVNEILDNDAQSDLFVTIFYAIWDPAHNRLTYANGGHNPPLLIRANGSTELLHNSGMALGVLPTIQVRQHTLTLHPGDTLVCYTDGITESMNEDLDEFGLKRLHLAADHARRHNAAAIIETITQEVNDHAGDSPQFDDMTLIVLKREQQP